uniref:MOG interacting and ectopic P-granules protein 1 n=1 Tax=Lygus hesperus TaxID=30085 RepID=A0A0K8THL7_LYGHE
MTQKDKEGSLITQKDKVGSLVHVSTYEPVKNYTVVLFDLFDTYNAASMIGHMTPLHLNAIGNMPNHKLEEYRCPVCWFQTKASRQMVAHMNARHLNTIVQMPNHKDAEGSEFRLVHDCVVTSWTPTDDHSHQRASIKIEDDDEERDYSEAVDYDPCDVKVEPDIVVCDYFTGAKLL